MSFFLEQFIGRSAICILMMLWLDGLHVARTDARQSSVTSGWLTRDPYFIVTERATACCCLLLRGTSLPPRR